MAVETILAGREDKAIVQLRGRWEVREMQENLVAQAFWRRVIHGYTDGHFVEQVLDTDAWVGPVQSFDNTDR